MLHVGDVIHAEVEDDLVPNVKFHVLEHPVGVAGRGQGSEGGDQDQGESQDHGGPGPGVTGGGRPGKPRRSLETKRRSERTSRILWIMIMMITEDRDAEVLVFGVLQETEKME